MRGIVFNTASQRAAFLKLIIHHGPISVLHHLKLAISLWLREVLGK
jgi:hypothetical protein